MQSQHTTISLGNIVFVLACISELHCTTFVFQHSAGHACENQTNEEKQSGPAVMDKCPDTWRAPWKINFNLKTSLTHLKPAPLKKISEIEADLFLDTMQSSTATRINRDRAALSKRRASAITTFLKLTAAGLTPGKDFKVNYKRFFKSKPASAPLLPDIDYETMSRLHKLGKNISEEVHEILIWLMLGG